MAPTNILLNYLLVWGPFTSLRLGFIGAPIATAISLNLITFFYCLYGLWIAPRAAWHPITKECLQDLGILFKLGISGVGQVAAEVSSKRSEYAMSESQYLFTVVELGTRRSSVVHWAFTMNSNSSPVAASQLGPIDLAVQSVCLVSAATSYQAPLALGVATSVR